MQNGLKISEILAVCLLATSLGGACHSSESNNPGFIDKKQTSDLSALETIKEKPSEEQKEYLFRTAWIWKYKNELIPVGEWGHEGEMVVYHDSLSGAWLFTGESYGTTDEMAEWILGLPSGIFISSYQDENSRRTLLRDTLSVTLLRTPEEQKQMFTETAKAKGHRKKFGENKYGWPVLEGTAWQISYSGTTEQTTLYLASTKLNTLALHGFNLRSGDARLPVRFPSALPPGMMLLEDDTHTSGGRIHFQLKEISDTEYHVLLKP